MAREAGVENLLLNHLSAKHGDADPALTARREFGGGVWEASDGLVLDLVTGTDVTGSSAAGNAVV